jgi:hypothetical protein
MGFGPDAEFRQDRCLARAGGPYGKIHGGHRPLSAAGKQAAGSPYIRFKEIAMAKASTRGVGRLAALLIALPLLQAVPALAQETPDQFNAANAETRRYQNIQNQLRNQAHDLRDDRTKGLLQCQGAGSGAAQSACSNNLDIKLRQRGLNLNNQIIQERDNHNLILKGTGVHRVP